MERSGTGLNWRSQAGKPTDVSLKAAFGDSSAGVGSRGSWWCISASVGVILAMEAVSTAGKWVDLSCVTTETMLFIMRIVR